MLLSFLPTWNIMRLTANQFENKTSMPESQGFWLREGMNLRENELFLINWMECTIIEKRARNR
jgi:hypothetical protein